MEYRTGRTGWKVSEVGYGMWGMGEWKGSDDEESRQSLRRAVGSAAFFDTAWAYGSGTAAAVRRHQQTPTKRLCAATRSRPNRKYNAARLQA